MKFAKIIKIAAFLFFLPSFSFAQPSPPPLTPEQYCHITDRAYQTILHQVEIKNPTAISALPECFKLDRKLMLKAALIDPMQFQYAADILKEDEVYMKRLLKVSPSILQFASTRIRMDQDFMESATYLNREALQYADPRLLNIKLFMKKMIAIDSKNYQYASQRLQELPEFAEMAFRDNGLMLQYAPEIVRDNRRLVEIAVRSNSSAFDFASEELKKDKELQKLSNRKTSIKSPGDLERFVQQNYVAQEKKKNLGIIITNRMKFFKKSALIERNYVTKWQRNLNFRDYAADEEMRLITADSRNYPILWKEDFKKYPDLYKKIERFFQSHRIDQATIDNLSTTFLWRVKSKPLTLVFNIYLLRDSRDADLGPEFSDVTSLTAIAQKRGNRWEMTVVEVIFDSEIKVEVGYRNGHKKHVVWDLYKVSKNDTNPKIIFKVEDKFAEYFEVFEEQAGGKYQMIQHIDPLLVGEDVED